MQSVMHALTLALDDVVAIVLFSIGVAGLVGLAFSVHDAELSLHEAIEQCPRCPGEFHLLDECRHAQVGECLECGRHDVLTPVGNCPCGSREIRNRRLLYRSPEVAPVGRSTLLPFRPRDRSSTT